MMANDQPSDKNQPPHSDSATGQSGLLQELLAQARDGDDSARDELFRKCRSYINLVARAQVETWLQAKVDASDLVQQTMMDAHQGFANFRGNTEGEWRAWLRRILDNNTFDFVRQFKGTEKRQINKEFRFQMPKADDSESPRYEPSANVESPSQFVLRQEQEILIADAIGQLDEDYQEVILLRNLQRLSFNDIAERMGRSRPAVQMLWMRAVKKLQEVMTNGESADD